MMKGKRATRTLTIQLERAMRDRIQEDVQIALRKMEDCNSYKTNVKMTTDAISKYSLPSHYKPGTEILSLLRCQEKVFQQRAYELRTKETFKEELSAILNNIEKYCTLPIEDQNFVLQCFIRRLLDRLLISLKEVGHKSVLSTTTSPNAETVPIDDKYSRAKQTAFRSSFHYVVGFILKKLKKKYEKYREANRFFACSISDLKTASDDAEQWWTISINRGGLILNSRHVFNFFFNLNEVLKPTFSNIRKLSGNVYAIVQNVALCDQKLMYMWWALWGVWEEGDQHLVGKRALKDAILLLTGLRCKNIARSKIQEHRSQLKSKSKSSRRVALRKTL